MTYETNFMLVFRMRLRELLDERKMSQKDLAEKCGTTAATISRWLSGTNIPDAQGVISAANAFGVTTDYMLGLSSIRNREERWLSVEKRFITDIYERAKPEDKYVIWALLQRYLKNDIEVEAFRKLLETLEK
ncbi:MAG: helix-turn-helix transcriptional regulator [Ruminococcus sp.]|nr:helix-turn-helix transcriptional regulator [Ruminococcus sp.]